MFIKLCAHGPGSVGWNDLLSLLPSVDRRCHIHRNNTIRYSLYCAGLEEVYPPRGEVHEAAADQGYSLHAPAHLRLRGLPHVLARGESPVSISVVCPHLSICLYFCAKVPSFAAVNPPWLHDIMTQGSCDKLTNSPTGDPY